jgi:hypothetical protein
MAGGYGNLSQRDADGVDAALDALKNIKF